MVCDEKLGNYVNWKKNNNIAAKSTKEQKTHRKTEFENQQAALKIKTCKSLGKTKIANSWWSHARSFEFCDGQIFSKFYEEATCWISN